MSNNYIWLSSPLHKSKFDPQVYRITKNEEGEDKVQKAKFFNINSVDYLKYSFEGSVIAFDEKILQDNIDLKRKIDLAKIGYEKLELPKYVKTEDDLIKVLLYYAEEE